MKHKRKQSFWQRHKHIKHTLIGAIIITVCAAGFLALNQLNISRHQEAIAEFYDTSSLVSAGPVGEIVRSEPLDITVQGGTATRILYRTQRANGTATFSSGMIFVPTTPATGQRSVVAWAHGTLGMGDQCAPSRTANPLTNISWVNAMMQNGWVVAATDYAGLGTPGVEGYLVGGDEAHDVLNSVRAARNLPGSQAGSDFTVWGHSQGGHSALFTASMAQSYAPELSLKGTVASAPAAEIVSMLQDQQNNIIDWVIGPEILTSWPSANPALSVNDLLTPIGKQAYQKVAAQCIDTAALGGMIRNNFNQTFFAVNPVDKPEWLAQAQAQTAPVLATNQPLLVSESTSDNVIPPQTTASYIQRACNGGSNVSSFWVANTAHMAIPEVISPTVITWLNDRFAGKPHVATCDQKLPVQPQ